MPTETTPRRPALVILAAYSAIAIVLSIIHAQVAAALAQGLVLIATVTGSRVKVLGDWLPWLALPVLYWSAPATLFGPMHDATVQRWDLALFGTQPARQWAVSFPSRSLSEILHLAYLSYYLVIYLPPVALYFIHRDEASFTKLTLAFTLAMVLSLIGFALFPAEGPRYQWGALASVPSGPFRHFATVLLERGSAHGTAFPSSHVAIAVAQSLSTLRCHRHLGYWVALTTLLLSVGAVYGGFHYASDVLAGVLFGVLAVALARQLGPHTA